MSKFLVSILALAFLAVTFSEGSSLPKKSAAARIEIVKDIRAFRSAHPAVELIPLATTRSIDRQQITYTIGQRQQGDQLVAVNQESQAWEEPQDLMLTISYPASGTGATVTYARIVVQQSSSEGRGYVVAGGIGQRFIQIIIEASKTTFFTYSSQIYGR
ncbi:uncharacterized protein LOC129759253 [Uranotaenia lowii]|uniref:uncharacterized protein LOC129759253 n=1 Tax=Uranotaenia lowii TaxID=190385 RepID=UPI002478F8F2|nr:uncharacterized protein LOC129759253 [Uranotaenia lowii]